ncbi:MAG TPA: TolC family protein [Abditibacteriaceae bacterium]
MSFFVRKISPFVLPCFVFVVFVQLAFAQEPPPVPAIDAAVPSEPERSVDELIRQALARSPQLPVARAAEETARQRLGAARVFPGATLQLVPRLAGSREASDEEIVLSQSLDVFGRQRARANVASAQLRAAEAQSVLSERALIIEVKNAATQLFASQEAENLGRVQVEVAKLFRDAAARRADLGDVPPVQVQRAELELLRVQNELTGAQAERLVRRAAMNQLVGQAPETPLRVVLPNSTVLSGGQSSDASNLALANSEDLARQRKQLLPQALANRPDILGAQATLEARRAGIQLLRRERLPEVELQARRSSFGRSGSTALRAVVTIPFFGSNKRERRALEAEARGEEAQVALLQSQAAAQIEQALLRLQQQQQTVQRFRTGIVPLTLELLRKTQIGYAEGASTYLEVLEAQRTLRQVQAEYLQALVGVRTVEAQLEGALGAAPSDDLLGNVSNPVGPATPDRIAPLGTVPENVVPPVPQEPVVPFSSPDARRN